MSAAREGLAAVRARGYGDSMPTDTDSPTTQPSNDGAERGALAASWGAFVGLLPHALHHVGFLTGVSLLAGATGQAMIAVIGLVASLPFLARLKRGFGTWKAPATALGVMILA